MVLQGTLPSIDNYFIGGDYVINPSPEIVTENAEKAQRRVYDLALTYPGPYLDLGCGHRNKLGTVDVVRVDKIEQDDIVLRDLDKEPLSISNIETVVCADVIEHMINPEFLLTTIRRTLDNPMYEIRAIISTPERDLVRGLNHYGPPPNKCHVREWNYKEFRDLLNHYFNVEYIGLSANADLEGKLNTIVAVVS